TVRFWNAIWRKLTFNRAAGHDSNAPNSSHKHAIFKFLKADIRANAHSVKTGNIIRRVLSMWNSNAA
ncbi:MAG: hypothetical protein WBM93_12020, partial [Parasphingorhabdus sp.]